MNCMGPRAPFGLICPSRKPDSTKQTERNSAGSIPERRADSTMNGSKRSARSWSDASLVVWPQELNVKKNNHEVVHNALVIIVRSKEQVMDQLRSTEIDRKATQEPIGRTEEIQVKRTKLPYQSRQGV